MPNHFRRGPCLGLFGKSLTPAHVFCLVDVFVVLTSLSYLNAPLTCGCIRRPCALAFGHGSATGLKSPAPRISSCHHVRACSASPSKQSNSTFVN